MATGHPFLLSVGDWVLAGEQRPLTRLGRGNDDRHIEVCEVTGMVEKGKGHYDVHLAGEDDAELVRDYYALRHIPISDESLQAFGFEPCDNIVDSWLYDSHRWRLDCREVDCPDLDYFYISWMEDENDLSRSYRIVCRGYGEVIELLEDTISEMQHFFFRFNGEYPMPLKYHGRTHFPPVKRFDAELMSGMVRLKPEARLKRMVKPGDFLGCRNMRRILNILTAHNIRTYGDLAALTEADVLKWRNFGKVCFDELCQVMKMWNIEFKQV